MKIILDFETHDPYVSTDGRNLGAGWVYKCNVSDSDFEVLGAGIGGDVKPFFTSDIEKIKQVVEKADSIICHNALYDLGCLLAIGIPLKTIYKKNIFDTMLAAKLYDSSLMSYSLANLSKKYLKTYKGSNALGDAAFDYDLFPWLKKEIAAKKRADKAGVPYKRPKPPQARLNKWAYSHMKDLMKSCPEVISKYCLQDVKCTGELFKIFYGLKQPNKTKLFKFVDKLIKLVLKMRLKGVHVDLKRAREVKEELDLNLKLKMSALNKLAKRPVDIWSNQSIEQAYRNLKIRYPKTPLGNPSFTKAWLGSHDHELSKMITDARTIDKINRDFVTKIIELQKYTCPDAKDVGKVYPDWKIFGAQTGRFSCSSPNLQQIPKRDPYLGKLCRSLFIPKPGNKMFALDYSNQEGRLQLHFAFERKCQGSDILVAEFLRNPNLDMHQKVADMAKISRSDAKTINLGLSYGMGLEKLAKSLGVSELKATEIKQKYMKGAPHLQCVIQKCKFFARKKKYIETIYGRRCTVLPDEDYKAFNKMIQGSAGDQTLLAMILCDAAGLDIILTVHDELVIQGSVSEARKCKHIMETCIKLHVPVVVDLNKKGGDNWSEA